MAAGDLIQKSLVVSDLSLESIEGTSCTVPTIVHVDFDVGSLTFTAEFIKASTLTDKATIQPVLQLTDPLSETVLDGNVIGLHAQYYV
jgi:hypothetical protein